MGELPPEISQRPGQNERPLARAMRMADTLIGRVAGGDEFVRWFIWGLVALVGVVALLFGMKVLWDAFIAHWLLYVGSGVLVLICIAVAVAPRRPPKHDARENVQLPPDRTIPQEPPKPSAKRVQKKTALEQGRRAPTGYGKFDEYKWGDPAPSRKQFGYAVSLGIAIVDGMTKGEMSEEIDEKLAERGDDPPVYKTIAWGSPAPRRIDVAFAADIGVAFKNGMTAKDVEKAAIAAEDATQDAGPAEKDQLSYIKEMHGELPRKITYGEAEKVIEFLQDYELPCPFCRKKIHAMDDRCWSCNKSLRSMRIPIFLDQ